MNARTPGILLAALLLGACATAPKPLQGEFTAVNPQDGAAKGTLVRWGGEIISVEPGPSATCFQILARDLYASARPRTGDTSLGRFLACRQGFYDPAVFTEGRDVTVVGALAGSETRRIGEFDYPLPLVDANVVYLWPERTYYDHPYYYYGPDPFFYPGFWGWGGYYGYRRW